jgi:trimethyllysine dioxygenase
MVLWGAKIEQSPPAISYEEAMTEDDKGLFKWLSNIVSSFLDIPWRIF